MFGRRERGVAETLDKVVYLMPPPRLGMLWCLLLDDKKRLESLGGSGKSPHLQTTKKSRRLDLVTTVAVITDSVLCWVGGSALASLLMILMNSLASILGCTVAGGLLFSLQRFSQSLISFAFSIDILLPNLDACFLLIFCHFI